MKKTTRIQKRPRLPGEVPTAMTAIRNNCLFCMGYQSADVADCTSDDCWCYLYRLGRGPTELEVDQDSLREGRKTPVVAFLEPPR